MDVNRLLIAADPDTPPDLKRVRSALVVGTLTHQAIAAYLREYGADPSGGTDTLGEIMDRLVGPADRRATRSVRLMVVGHAVTYLRWFLPPPTWQLQGTEVAVSPGLRVDVSWLDDRDRVVYDELKLGWARRDAAALAQVRRYVAAGVAAHGPAFGGARLIILGGPGRSVYVAPDGEPTPLAITTTEPAPVCGIVQ